jgi:hypothetical protein
MALSEVLPENFPNIMKVIEITRNTDRSTLVNHKMKDERTRIAVSKCEENFYYFCFRSSLKVVD